jgi:hypothetical protein
MPSGGGGYGTKEVGGTVATTLKRKPAGQQVSYNNTKLRPRSKGGNGHLGTVAPLPKP